MPYKILLFPENFLLKRIIRKKSWLT